MYDDNKFIFHMMSSLRFLLPHFDDAGVFEIGGDREAECGAQHARIVTPYASLT
jgi:hypothetical protein